MVQAVTLDILQAAVANLAVVVAPITPPTMELEMVSINRQMVARSKEQALTVPNKTSQVTTHLKTFRLDHVPLARRRRSDSEHIIYFEKILIG